MKKTPAYNFGAFGGAPRDRGEQTFMASGQEIELWMVWGEENAVAIRFRGLIDDALKLRRGAARLGFVHGSVDGAPLGLGQGHPTSLVPGVDFIELGDVLSLGFAAVARDRGGYPVMFTQHFDDGMEERPDAPYAENDIDMIDELSLITVAQDDGFSAMADTPIFDRHEFEGNSASWRIGAFTADGRMCIGTLEITCDRGELHVYAASQQG